MYEEGGLFELKCMYVCVRESVCIRLFALMYTYLIYFKREPQPEAAVSSKTIVTFVTWSTS